MSNKGSRFATTTIDGVAVPGAAAQFDQHIWNVTVDGSDQVVGLWSLRAESQR